MATSIMQEQRSGALAQKVSDGFTNQGPHVASVCTFRTRSHCHPVGKRFGRSARTALRRERFARSPRCYRSIENVIDATHVAGDAEIRGRRDSVGHQQSLALLTPGVRPLAVNSGNDTTSARATCDAGPAKFAKHDVSRLGSLTATGAVTSGQATATDLLRVSSEKSLDKFFLECYL
jgi:hypothetical protein